MAIYSSEFSQEITARLISCEKKLIILSAFVKVDALTILSKYINCSDVTIIVRWQKGDIVYGASDLEVFQLCQSKGWKFGICSRLHAKVFVFDQKDILLGSANVTGKGLGLVNTMNLEFGTHIEATQEDISKINSIISDEVTWVDKPLFKLIESEVHHGESVNDSFLSTWSRDILKRIEKPISKLWVAELIFSTPDEVLTISHHSEKKTHDLSLLGIYTITPTPDAVKAKFIETKIYKWLINIFRENDSLSYGQLTNLLHNALLDDPSPYRKTVKEFVSILFTWFEFLENFYVTRPRHSQVVSYLEEEVIEWQSI